MSPAQFSLSLILSSCSLTAFAASSPAPVMPVSAAAVAAAVPPAVPATEALAPPVAFTAAEIFGRTSPYVFKLDTRLKGSKAEREHGTAFVIDQTGLLATNYHVVADYVDDPAKYEIVVYTAGQAQVGRVLAVDPVNDLAVVKVEMQFPGQLTVGPAQAPAVGDPLFSIGFPKSEQISITQGNFNGERVMGFAPALTLAMPLNPGMSGGPCLDRFGAVVGVNRAMQREAQNISYLSPGAALTALLPRARGALATAPTSLKQGVSGDVLAREQFVYGQARVGDERQRLGAISFAAPLGGMNCGQDQVTTITRANEQYIMCSTLSLALLSTSQTALDIKIIGIQSEGALATPAFKPLRAAYTQAGRPPGERGLASIGPSPRESCSARAVRNQNQVAMHIRFCSFEIPDFPGLYNTFVKIDLDGKKVSIAQSYQGMSLRAAGQLVDRFTKEVKYEASR